MNRHETGRVIAMLQAEYSAHRVPDPEALLFSWGMNLGAVPFEAAAAAAAAWVRSGERFFPTSGQLLQLVATESGAVPSAADAFALVLDRMRSTYPGRPAAPWDAPDATRHALKAIGGMASVRASDDLAVTQAMFAKAYEVYRQRAVRSADLSEASWSNTAPAIGAGAALDDGAIGIGGGE